MLLPVDSSSFFFSRHTHIAPLFVYGKRSTSLGVNPHCFRSLMSNVSCVKATAAFLADGWLSVVSPPNGRETARLTLATQHQEALGAAPSVSLRVTCVKMAPEERAKQKIAPYFICVRKCIRFLEQCSEHPLSQFSDSCSSLNIWVSFNILPWWTTAAVLRCSHSLVSSHHISASEPLYWISGNRVEYLS